MRSAGILDFNFPREGYGPSIVTTDFGKRVRQANYESVKTALPIVKFIADWFSSRDVRYLEKVATAYYVTLKLPKEPLALQAGRITSLKPHVDLESAEEAIRVVEEKRKLAAHGFERTPQ
jgi:hypothetical protein